MIKPYIIIGILLPFILATLSCTPPTGMHLAEQWVDKNRGALELRFSEFLFPFEVGPGTNPVEWQFHELPSTTTEHVIIVAVASQELLYENQTLEVKVPFTLIVNRRDADAADSVVWARPDPLQEVLASAHYPGMKPALHSAQVE